MAWQRVDLVVEGRHAEALAEALDLEGALTTEITDADAGTAEEQAVYAEPGAEAGLWPRCRVSALFALGADAPGAVARAMEAAGSPALAAASISRIDDRDWVAETQRQFEPIRAAERVWIVPGWHEPPEPNAINVFLDPGAAFGTGSHPTTRLCIGWLERNVRGGERVLDYGCGSGILAIAALKLGAGSAVGVDIDPLALETARYNAERNGVFLELVSAQGSVPGPVRLAVANILANPLRMLAPIIGGHTAPGGMIALSGILEDQAQAVAAAYAPWARLAVEASESGWVLLAGQRRPAPC